MSADTDPLSASQPTGDRTQAAVGGPIVSATSTAGQSLAMPNVGRIAIWQLSGPFERQVNDSVRDDIPSAPVVPVWFFATDGSSPDSSYRDAGAGSRSSRVYHVDAFPGDQRHNYENSGTTVAIGFSVVSLAPVDNILTRFAEGSAGAK